MQTYIFKAEKLQDNILQKHAKKNKPTLKLLTYYFKNSQKYK